MSPSQENMGSLSSRHLFKRIRHSNSGSGDQYRFRFFNPDIADSKDLAATNHNSAEMGYLRRLWNRFIVRTRELYVYSGQAEQAIQYLYM